MLWVCVCVVVFVQGAAEEVLREATRFGFTRCFFRGNVNTFAQRSHTFRFQKPSNCIVLHTRHASVRVSPQHPHPFCALSAPIFQIHRSLSSAVNHTYAR